MPVSRTKARKDDGPHHCPLGCGVSTIRKYDMTRHLEKHDPTTQFNYACPAACGQTSRQRSNIRLHFETCRVAAAALRTGVVFSPEALAVLGPAPRKNRRRAEREVAPPVFAAPLTASDFVVRGDSDADASATPSPMPSLGSSYTVSPGQESSSSSPSSGPSFYAYSDEQASAQSCDYVKTDAVPFPGSTLSQMTAGYGLAGGLELYYSLFEQGMGMDHPFNAIESFLPKAQYFDDAIYPPLPQTTAQLPEPLFPDPIPDGMTGLFGFREVDYSNFDFGGMEFDFSLLNTGY